MGTTESAQHELTQSITPGRYRHFKGKEYTVLGVARHTESGESMVVYRAEYGERALCVRPYGMFIEHVDKPEYNYSGPRFQYIGE
ncbi:DUF1653 domain-containing protein [Candidatus Berkelbacteria bacterium]|nr:DUF1653 domain-containing protein [Candidatus Berkelbacteria bacterium]